MEPTFSNRPLVSPRGSWLPARHYTLPSSRVPGERRDVKGEEREGWEGRVPSPRPELVVRFLQIVVQDPQVPILPGEGLAGCRVLQELSHSPQGVALRGSQGAACGHGHNVEGIRGHHSGVQEAVVQEVPHHLRAKRLSQRSPEAPLPAPALHPQLPWADPFTLQKTKQTQSRCTKCSRSLE